MRQVYLKKFQSSLTYWTKNGGALPEKVVRELEDTDLQFENLGNPKNNRNYKQEHKVIRFKKYPDDVPIKNFRLVPSYKRMCITILKMILLASTWVLVKPKMNCKRKRRP